MTLNQKNVESCPQKNEIFKTIKTWEEARAANAFSRQIKKMLMKPEFSWRLEAGKDGNSWTLFRLENNEKTESFMLERAKGVK